jgi:hypothetical protein
LRSKAARRNAAEQLSNDDVDGLQVAQPEKERGQARQDLGVGRSRQPPVSQEVPEDVKGRTTGLIGSNVGLQSRHAPDIVHNVPDNDHVGPVRSVESHDAMFFFIVSKERAAKIIAM